VGNFYALILILLSNYILFVIAASPSRSYQVRGHLAAEIDPLGLNNMEREKAKKMIIRSVTVDQKVGRENPV
jgi:2-oxoglutarate dehydrogenase complex dehydrogenase (E1) component-like enzyme